MGNVSSNYYGSPPSYGSLYSSKASISGLPSSASSMEDLSLTGDAPPTYEQAAADAPPAYQQSRKTVDPNNKGIHGFLGGMWDGVKGAVHSLFTPKGALMAAAGVAACIAFPVAAPLVLGGAAVAIGGSHMVKGFKDGNMREVGNGTTGVLMGAGGIAGARAFGPQGETASAGETASETAAAAEKPSLFSRGWSKAQDWVNTAKSWATGKPKTTETQPAGAPAEEIPPLKPHRPYPQDTAGSESLAPAAKRDFQSTYASVTSSRRVIPQNSPAAEVKPPLEEPPAPAAETTAEEADAAAQNAGTKMGPWDRLKNSQQGQYFSQFGEKVRTGETFKDKMRPFAAPASVAPANMYDVSSLNPPMQQQA